MIFLLMKNVFLFSVSLFVMVFTNVMRMKKNFEIVIGVKLVCLWPNSAILVNKIDNFVEIFLLRIVDLLITRKYCDITMTVTNCNPATVVRPSQAIERAASLRDWLTDDWHFSVCIDVPDINEAFSVTRRENTGMSRTPTGIIDIFLSALESNDWFRFRVGRPKFYGPVHGRRKK